MFAGGDYFFANFADISFLGRLLSVGFAAIVFRGSIMYACKFSEKKSKIDFEGSGRAPALDETHAH